MSIKFVTLFVLLIPFGLCGQDNQQVSDEMLGVQDEDLNYQDQLENLSMVLAQRVDINKANADQFRILNILTESQIREIINYRDANGKFLSIYELQAVPEIDLTTIDRMRGFIKVQDPNAKVNASVLRQQVSEGNHYLIYRYATTHERSLGYEKESDDDKKFKGNPGQHYVRFRSSRPGIYSIGVTAENDGGEPIQWSPSNSQFGFDFISSHIRLENRGRVKNLIIGDYNAQFGQGLTLGGGFGYGKSSESVLAARKCHLGFIPYTSSNESSFFRGIATTLSLTNMISVSLAYSSLLQDANLYSDSLGQFSTSSMIGTGLHRNEKELKAKDNIRESHGIASVDIQRGQLQTGLIMHTTSYAQNINRKDNAYNQFSFSGDEIINFSLYWNYAVNNLLTFGEISKTLSHGSGAIAGALFSASSKLDLAIVYRNYQRDFITTYSNAISESTTPQNETGVYWGWKSKITKKITTSGYVDIFHFPWLRFRSYRPSNGHEWLLMTSYQPSKTSLIKIQMREESKVRNNSSAEPVYQTSIGVKRNYLLSVSVVAEKRVHFNTRIQGSTYSLNGATTKGLALFQDMGLDFGKFSVAVRHAIFQTDDYDNRQYAYEKDVYMAFSIPAVSGVGVRNYLLLQYTINKNLAAWFKYSRIRYTDKDEIGSGADTIMGPVKNDLKFQLILKL